MKRDEATKLAERGLAELNAALQQGASETLVRYLDVLARFHRYSFGNVMLIASQKPDATQVAGFHTWKTLGRWVKKGEQGIAILAPMVGRKRRDDDESPATDDNDGSVRQLFGFRVVHVFDVSQTEGDELPEFAGIHGDPGEGLRRLEGIVADYGIQLEYDFPGCGAQGVSRDGTIVVRPDMPPAETFAVLVHELSHEFFTSRQDENERCLARCWRPKPRRSPMWSARPWGWKRQLAVPTTSSSTGATLHAE